LQYAEAGSPPLETWLDAYLRKTLNTPYYVALLSAAETYRKPTHDHATYPPDRMASLHPVAQAQPT